MAQSRGGRSSGTRSGKSSKSKRPSRAGRSSSTRSHSARRRSGAASRATKGAGTDALSLLAHDHRNVEKLFKRAQKDPTLFEQIREALDLHTRVEEEIFYPALKAALSDNDGEIVEEALGEHQEVKDLVAELVGLDRQGEQFEDRLQKLQDNVERHVEEEEGEMFKKARRALSHAALAMLGAQMQTLKTEIQAVLAQA
jgi:hemerythrin-like domain-containing protein